MMLRSFHVILAIVAMCLVSSCSSIECGIDNLVTCVWNFEPSVGSDYSSIYFSLSSRRVSDGNDTVLVNRKAELGNVKLPMSYALNADTLTLTVERQMEDGFIELGKDIVIVEKTNEPIFESVDCSPRFHHTIKNVKSSHNYIDTIEVVNEKVLNQPANENLRLYLYPVK